MRKVLIVSLTFVFTLIGAMNTAVAQNEETKRDTSVQKVNTFDMKSVKSYSEANDAEAEACCEQPGSKKCLKKCKKKKDGKACSKKDGAKACKPGCEKAGKKSCKPGCEKACCEKKDK